MPIIHTMVQKIMKMMKQEDPMARGLFDDGDDGEVDGDQEQDNNQNVEGSIKLGKRMNPESKFEQS